MLETLLLGPYMSQSAAPAGTLEVVARFLGLLELYREGVIAFDQVEALGDLHVRWTGESGDPGAAEAGAEEYDAPVEEDA